MENKVKPVVHFHKDFLRDMNSTYYFFFNLVTSIYTWRHMEPELEGGNQALKIASHPEGKCDRRGP